MLLTHIEAENFRLLGNASIALSPGVNFIHHAEGHGGASIPAAAEYACIGECQWTSDAYAWEPALIGGGHPDSTVTVSALLPEPVTITCYNPPRAGEPDRIGPLLKVTNVSKPVVKACFEPHGMLDFVGDNLLSVLKFATGGELPDADLQAKMNTLESYPKLGDLYFGPLQKELPYPQNLHFKRITETNIPEAQRTLKLAEMELQSNQPQDVTEYDAAAHDAAQTESVNLISGPQGDIQDALDKWEAAVKKHHEAEATVEAYHRRIDTLKDRSGRCKNVLKDSPTLPDSWSTEREYFEGELKKAESELARREFPSGYLIETLHKAKSDYETARAALLASDELRVRAEAGDATRLALEEITAELADLQRVGPPVIGEPPQKPEIDQAVQSRFDALQDEIARHEAAQRMVFSAAEKNSLHAKAMKALDEAVDQLRMWTVLGEALGPNGIRAQVFSQRLVSFVDEVNAGLQHLGPLLKLDQRTLQWQGVTARRAGGKVVPQKMLSRSQRLRQSIVVKVVLARRTGFNLIAESGLECLSPKRVADVVKWVASQGVQALFSRTWSAEDGEHNPVYPTVRWLRGDPSVKEMFVTEGQVVVLK
jgi:hypothetical protein